METKMKKGMTAISQILILVVAIFAFAWIIGGVESVSAAGVDDSLCKVAGGDCYDIPSARYNTADTMCKKIVDKDSTYLANKCGGSSTTFYCCVPPKGGDSKDTTGGNTQDKEENEGGNALDQGGDVLKAVAASSVGAVGSDALKGALGIGEKTATTTGATAVPQIPSTALGAFPGTLSVISAAVAAAAAAYVMSTAFRALADWAKLNPTWKNALGAIGAGAGAAATLAIAFPSTMSWLSGLVGLSALPGAFILGGAIALITFLFSSSTKEQGVVYYYCQPWDAKVKGEDCHLCNEQSVECSEYQCKSLGQSCEFVQSDNQTGSSFCFWNSRNDIDPPVISPDSEVLSVGYNYGNPKAVSPPDKGVWIKDTKSSDGCLSPFTQVTFGVTLDEPAKCKIDFQRQNDYEKMANYLGGSQTRKFNHTQTLVIPQMNTTVGKDNLISAYVRCQDSNGNANIHDFVFEMCVAKGPDTTAPTIYGTSIENGAKVAFNVTSAKVDFYVNEPANCKWSFSDKKYEDMDYNMSCATDAKQINLRASYTCNTDLTGIKSVDKTDYFVRCQDVSPQNNTNTQSYKYSLQSSKALSIILASPNATEIKDSTTPSTVKLEAKTLGGTYDGKALCSYSDEGTDGTYTYFENTGSSNIHSTEIHIPKGDYTYYIKCDDLGGNSDTVVINFNVSIDVDAPLIARAYYDNGLKIITNEKAECVYSTSSCDYSFEDGVGISSYDGLSHNADWNTDEDLYIKCQDIYGNRPALANVCSITLRAQNRNNL